MIRDLIVDMTQFFNQYHSIKPYVIDDRPMPENERLQSPQDQAALDGTIESILCACCSTACPSFFIKSDEFAQLSENELLSYQHILTLEDSDLLLLIQGKATLENVAHQAIIDKFLVSPPKRI